MKKDKKVWSLTVFIYIKNPNIYFNIVDFYNRERRSHHRYRCSSRNLKEKLTIFPAKIFFNAVSWCVLIDF